jgi:hypothetical protein
VTAAYFGPALGHGVVAARDLAAGDVALHVPLTAVM